MKPKKLWIAFVSCLLVIAFIVGCRDENVEKVGVCPIVISTNPESSAENVILDSSITVTFNEPMNPLTITPDAFTLVNLGSSDSTGRVTGSAISGSLTYDAETATMTFVPNENLVPNRTYTGTVMTSVKDQMGNALQTPYIWNFKTIKTIHPTITFADPGDGDTDVFINKKISAKFSTKMDSLSVNLTTFTLKQGTTTVAGTVSYKDSIAVFSPSTDLSSGTEYTATITTGVRDSSGTAVEEDFIWKFTTGTIVAPEITATSPENEATGVALNKLITATFSEAMNSSTVLTSFKLMAGNTVIAGTVDYSGTTATFTPADDLSSNTTYTATISTDAENVGGVALAQDYIWTFATGVIAAPTVTSTDPAKLGADVVLNKVVSAIFSEAMTSSTVLTSFKLMAGAILIQGTPGYSGTTATFTPTSDLSPNTTYTATISSGAQNEAGVGLAQDYVWTFTTVPAPKVISTNPAKLATNVVLDKVISAVFSETMNSATVQTSFELKAGATVVLGTVGYSGVTATFTPDDDLLPNTTYTATIKTGAQNATGVPLAQNYIWTFKTVPAPTVTSTDPVNLAPNVALNKVISATFSEAMNSSTIDALSFTLKTNNTLVGGTVNYSGMTATFTPDDSLLSGETYTATITTNAKTPSEVPLQSNHVWSFNTKAPAGGPFIDLKSVGRFGIIAGVGVSNNAGFSKIRDLDVGISPGVRTSITGFPPATIENGAMYASDDIAPPGTADMLILAKQELMDAYLLAEGATTPAPSTVAGDQGGLTLAPGIYKSTSTLLIQNGDLTLDAQGDVNAVWIFQVKSDFTTIGGAGGNVILSGGAQAKNVFWQVGSSATIGDNTSFKGNVLALTSITMNSGATAVGRMLAINGSVVLTSTNIIDKP